MHITAFTSYTNVIFGSMTFWDFGALEVDRGPQFGWYNIFRPRPLSSRAVLPLLASRPRRSQSRACRADARRLKRRRFLHALRGALA